MQISNILFTGLIFFFCTGCNAQPKQGKVYPVGFYNVENLFDIQDDPLTDDDEFTPNGKMRYTAAIYRAKLHNIASVLELIGTDSNKNGAVLIGLAEVENSTVLNDLLAQPEIKSRNYKYTWHNSNDRRGIDVALIYNASDFKIISSQPLPVRLGNNEITRDILYAKGVLGKDTVHVFVNHWPSRREGDETIERRAIAARACVAKVNSIRQQNPNARIIIMGDLNDNPVDASVSRVLGAAKEKNASLYNPWAEVYLSGKGTEVFQHKWNLFDQIIMSNTLLLHSGLHFTATEIVDYDFMTFTKGKAYRYPKRSFRGTFWNNGYSDHFPVVVYFRK